LENVVGPFVISVDTHSKNWWKLKNWKILLDGDFAGWTQPDGNLLLFSSTAGHQNKARTNKCPNRSYYIGRGCYVKLELLNFEIVEYSG
jgi:hypothetical protein